MNRFSLTALAAVAALVPISLAQAQSNPHAGMSMQDHAAMPDAPATTGRVTTTPADNAMLSTSPTTFSVSFPHAMSLTDLTLMRPAGRSVDIAIPASTRPAEMVSAPLPALTPGSYSAAWSATGIDGHTMTGVVRFMVH